MLFSTLSIFTAVLPAYVFAVPLHHRSVHIRDHSTISSPFHKLFPLGKGSSFWTTGTSVTDAVPLSTDSFNAFAIMDKAAPNFDTAPDGSPAMKVHFEQGAYDYKGPAGGLSFYATPIDLSNAKEVTYTYSLFFPDGFAFNKGGKLPGMYGGDNPETAISCSGGRRDTGCWSMRYMFRTNGAGELYTYLPQPDANESAFSGNKQLCDVGPESLCNSVYGASVGRGSFQWTTGQWTTVTQRIRLNDVDDDNNVTQNGEMELIVNGKSIFTVTGLGYRANKEGRIIGMIMQSFFGGHDESWASPKDQDIFFKDFTTAITQEL